MARLLDVNCKLIKYFWNIKPLFKMLSILWTMDTIIHLTSTPGNGLN